MKVGDRVKPTAAYRRKICASNVVRSGSWKLITCQARGGTVLERRSYGPYVLVRWDDDGESGALWFSTNDLVIIERQADVG